MDNTTCVSVATHTVLLQGYQHEMLKLADDNPFVGHLGVNKTFDRVLQCFFWSEIKGVEWQQCETHLVCQVACSPNQTVASYTSFPILAVNELFECVIVDCVSLNESSLEYYGHLNSVSRGHSHT